jgi:hypothetical protein
MDRAIFCYISPLMGDRLSDPLVRGGRFQLYNCELAKPSIEYKLWSAYLDQAEVEVQMRETK